MSATTASRRRVRWAPGALLGWSSRSASLPAALRGTPTASPTSGGSGTTDNSTTGGSGHRSSESATDAPTRVELAAGPSAVRPDDHPAERRRPADSTCRVAGPERRHPQAGMLSSGASGQCHCTDRVVQPLEATTAGRLRALLGRLGDDSLRRHVHLETRRRRHHELPTGAIGQGLETRGEPGAALN